MTSVQVRDDLRRPLSVATSALGLVAALLWVVAAGIVAMMAYLSGLDRYRDFAVFKALGATTRRLLLGVVLQGAVVGLVASSVAVSLAFALAPFFPVDIDLTGADAVTLVDGGAGRRRGGGRGEPARSCPCRPRRGVRQRLRAEPLD